MESSIRIACSLLTTILMVSVASAFDFYVGGSDGGWVRKPSEAYNHWAGRMRFQVHDSIVFKFKEGEDSVLVVEEDDYRSCNLKNPIRKMTSGSSVFLFDRSGPFFFVSGEPGSCINGQKLTVVVMSQRNQKMPSPVSNSPASPSPSPTPPMASPSPSPAEPPCEDDPLTPSPSPSPSKAQSPSTTAYAPTPAPEYSAAAAAAAYVTKSVSVVSLVMVLLGSIAFMV